MSKTLTATELEQARRMLRTEAQAVAAMADDLGDSFLNALKMIYECEGSVVVSGIGKAGIVGQKISATLASTGTPSHFLHAAEAVHGDLGRLRSQDLALVLSYSGESEEIVRLIALLKQLDVTMIAMTGNLESKLAQYSRVCLHLGKIEEICPLGLAPSTSTTCMLALGDALALTAMQMRNFRSEDYARYHPGGSLGRRLVTVEQAALFSQGKPLPQASERCTVREALVTAQQSAAERHGCVLLVDDAGRLTGLLTDGDLRRGVERLGAALDDSPVTNVMTKNPKTVHPDTLASEALGIFHRHRIDEIPVVDADHKPVGLIDVQDVVALKVLQ